ASEPEEEGRRLRTFVEEILKVRRVVAFRYAARDGTGKIAAVVLLADGLAGQAAGLPFSGSPAFAGETGVIAGVGEQVREERNPRVERSVQHAAFPGLPHVAAGEDRRA